MSSRGPGTSRRLSSSRRTSRLKIANWRALPRMRFKAFFKGSATHRTGPSCTTQLAQPTTEVSQNWTSMKFGVNVLHKMKRQNPGQLLLPHPRGCLRKRWYCTRIQAVEGQGTCSGSWKCVHRSSQRWFSTWSRSTSWSTHTMETSARQRSGISGTTAWEKGTSLVSSADHPAAHGQKPEGRPWQLAPRSLARAFCVMLITYGDFCPYLFERWLNSRTATASLVSA